MACIGDICEILDNKRVPITASDRKPGPYPYYGANGVQDFVADYIFDDELVLLAEDGGNFGSKEKPIAYRVSGKCWVNNHAHVLKPKDGLDVDYLCYALMFYDVTRLVNGATRQKLTQTDMRKIEIPLPPLEEQRKIAAVLDKIDSLISKHRQQLEKLGLLVKSQFVEMFGDPICIDKDMTLPRLGDVCVLKAGKFMKADDISENAYENSFPCYGGNGIRGYVPSYNCEGDFPLIGRQGALCGNVQYATGKFHATEHAVIVTPKIDMDRYWLYFLLFELKLNRYASGAAQPGLAVNNLEEIRVKIPPIEVQRRYSYIAQRADQSKFAINQSLEKLETLKKALMQDYFE